MAKEVFRKFSDYRWQEVTWFLLFLILYAWSSHAVVFSKEYGFKLGGRGRLQWPCRIIDGIGKKVFEKNDFIAHTVSYEHPILCSDVCGLGRLSFWLSMIAGVLFIVLSDESREVYKYALIVCAFGMIALSSLMNLPLAIRSIPAYACLGAMFSIGFKKPKALL